MQSIITTMKEASICIRKGYRVKPGDNVLSTEAGEVEDLYGKTRGLLGVGRIGAEVAKRAKAFEMPTLLINTARGVIVDEEALARALDGHLLGGAALDTLSEEPPGPGHVFYKLESRLPNLI
jgi:phosphoglycerate dehydrogenase-like enzyme